MSVAIVQAALRVATGVPSGCSSARPARGGAILSVPVLVYVTGKITLVLIVVNTAKILGAPQ